MLRFAAAVLAAAAIRPTPTEKGLARLSEALASPAVVNNDVLWARCGVLDKMAPHSAMLLHSDRGGEVVGGDGAVLSMLHGHGADGVDMDIGLAPSWKGTLYGTPLAATLAVEAALCNKAPQAMLPPGTLSSARLTYVALMEWVWISASRRAGRVPCMVRLWQQRLQLKLFSLIKLRKQCCLLVPFLFGEANPTPNLKPPWLATTMTRGAPRPARSGGPSPSTSGAQAAAAKATPKPASCTFFSHRLCPFVDLWARGTEAGFLLEK